MKQSLNLTAQESAFAAEHHHLVEEYLQQKELEKSEYYDVVIFGYLNGVIKHFRREEPKKYDFRTLAWEAMDSCYSNYLRSQNCIEYKGTVLSLYDRNGFYTLEETIADSRNTAEEVLSSIRIEETLAVFTERECEIVKLLVEDYPKSDILKKLGITAKELQGYISVIQTKTLASPLMQAA